MPVLNDPRPMTVDEMKEKLLNRILVIIDYWDKVVHTRPLTIKDRIEGAIFSTLVIFDGEDVQLPALDLIPKPHHTEEEYRKNKGENWWVEESLTRGQMLHDLLHKD